MRCDVREVSESLENEQSSQMQRYTAELILQPCRHFTYVTSHSPTLRRFTYMRSHSPTLPLLHLRYSSFSNPSSASPTSQALHIIHLASRPWQTNIKSMNAKGTGRGTRWIDQSISTTDCFQFYMTNNINYYSSSRIFEIPRKTVSEGMLTCFTNNVFIGG